MGVDNEIEATVELVLLFFVSFIKRFSFTFQSGHNQFQILIFIMSFHVSFCVSHLVRGYRIKKKCLINIQLAFIERLSLDLANWKYSFKWSKTLTCISGLASKFTSLEEYSLVVIFHSRSLVKHVCNPSPSLLFCISIVRRFFVTIK